MPSYDNFAGNVLFGFNDNIKPYLLSYGSLDFGKPLRKSAGSRIIFDFNYIFFILGTSSLFYDYIQQILFYIYIITIFIYLLNILYILFILSYLLHFYQLN